MPINQTRWPVRSTNNMVISVAGRFTGGGSAANCTRVAGGRGITSVNYDAATGVYLITFDGVGETFLGAMFSVRTAGGAASKVVNYGTYTPASRTLGIFVATASTPVAVDLALTEELTIHASFADTTVP